MVVTAIGGTGDRGAGRAGRLVARGHCGPIGGRMASDQTRIEQRRTGGHAEHEEQCDDSPQPHPAMIAQRPEWIEAPGESGETVLNRPDL